MCVRLQTRCGAHTVVAHCLIVGPNSLGRERGSIMSPCEDTWGKFQIGASELCVFEGRAGYLVLVLHLTPFLAGGT